VRKTVLLIARLFMAGEIKLMLEGSDLDPAAAVEPLTKIDRFKQVSILKRKVADANSLKRARELYKDLFQKLGREEEDALVADFRARLGEWQTDLKGFTLTANTAHHPGQAEIDAALTRIAQQLATRDSFAFIEALLSAKDGWLDATPDTSNKALRQLQDLKTRLASQTSIAQILYLQGQGGDAMDEAITLIEAAAAAAVAKPAQVAESGDATQPLQTGQPNVPPPVAKTTRVVRAAELSTKKYLETEADVDVYVAKLEAELLARRACGVYCPHSINFL
jgi:hypothetical protein